MRVNFNYEGTSTHTAYLVNQREMGKSLLRLSTGMRILEASDDAAGLFIADQLSIVATGLQEGNRNIATGISALKIAENASGQIFERLRGIYSRAVRAANDINDPNARAALQREIANLTDAIQKIGTDTEYNGIRLLDGTFAGKFIHYGARTDQVVNVSIADVRAQNLGAHLINTNGNKASGTDFNDTSFRGIKFNTAQTVTIGDRVVNASSRYGSGPGAFHLLDAGVIANEVNSYLGDIGFKAKAVNVSVGKEYTGIADVAGTADLTFYVGEKEVSISGLDTRASLDTLIEKINRAAATAGADLSASRSGNSLVLTSSQGYTIGLKVEINPSDASVTDAKINIDQLINDLPGKSSGTVNATTTGLTAAAVKVGDLYIARDSAFTSRLLGLSESTTSTSTVSHNGVYDSRKGDLSSFIGTGIAYSSAQTITIFGNTVPLTAAYGGVHLLDYGIVADAVNALPPSTITNPDGSTTTITYSATATNISRAGSYTADGIATVTLSNSTGSASANITFYVGGKSFTINGLALNITLIDLVDRINTAASAVNADLTASIGDANNLVLTSSRGYTIGVKVTVQATGADITEATIHLDRLLHGANFQIFTSAELGSGASSVTATAVLVGDLTVTQTTTTTTMTGLRLGDFVIGSDTGSQFKNLYSIDVNTNEGAEVGMLIADMALRTVDNIRSQIGAVINNLQSIFDAQKVAYDNTKQAENVIRNTDYAEEMTNFTTLQIKMQSTIAMLAQANTLPQLVLQLLR